MAENIYEPAFVKSLFNRMANSYEAMNYITSFGFSIRWRKQFIAHLGKSNKPIEVIDLLTGLGENWHLLKSSFPNANISALDFSDRMIEKALLKNNKKFSNNIHLIKEDVLNNSLKSNHFDIVSCAFGLKTFNENQIQILASEIKRILKLGGQFSFVEISSPQNFFLHLFYEFYLSKLIPLIGKVFLGNPEEYKMLWVYTRNFKDSIKATEIFKNAGLNVKYESYFLGCATGFRGYNLSRY